MMQIRANCSGLEAYLAGFAAIYEHEIRIVVALMLVDPESTLGGILSRVTAVFTHRQARYIQSWTAHAGGITFPQHPVSITDAFPRFVPNLASLIIPLVDAGRSHGRWQHCSSSSSSSSSSGSRSGCCCQPLRIRTNVARFCTHILHVRAVLDALSYRCPVTTLEILLRVVACI